MRRAPIVIGATIAGLAGVLTFHTRSASLALGSAPGVSATGGSSPSNTASAPPSASTTTPSRQTVPATTPSSTTPSSTTPPTTTPPTTTAPTTTRSATGQTVDYTYGSLSVSVTVSGSRVTKVGIASLDDGGDFRSQSIDQQSIPILEQQALQAQSANIQGVSGASYTSAGFENSLQSALRKLGL
jgi:uncharacterized protein with FMN-binding domain